MRKAIVFLLVFVLAVSVPFSSFADESNVIYIKELDLSVVVPAGYDTFTRDTAADDPLYSKYGMTHNQMLSTMKAQNSYLDAISGDQKTEITVSAFTTSNSDLDQLSDMAISAMGSTLKEQYSKNGLTVTDYQVYSNSQTKFVRMLAYRSVSGSTIHTLQYTTVFGGKTINFTLQSYSGTGVSSSQEAILKSIVDSVELNASSAKKASSNIPAGNSSSASKTDSKAASSIQSNQESISGFTLFYLAIAATVIYIVAHYYFKGRQNAKASEDTTKKEISSKAHASANVQPRVSESNIANHDSPRSITPQKDDTPKFCRKCGNRLLPDSIFCEHCGTKVH